MFWWRCLLFLCLSSIVAACSNVSVNVAGSFRYCTQPVTGLSVLPNNLLAAGSKDGYLYLKNVSSSANPSRMVVSYSWPTTVSAIDGWVLTAGTSDGWLNVWDQQKWVANQYRHRNAVVTGITGLWVAAYQKWVLFTSYSTGVVDAWDLGAPVSAYWFSFPSSPTSWFENLIALPDGRLASGHFDLMIRVWNWNARMAVTVINNKAVATSLSWLSSIGALVAGSGNTSTINLWNATTGQTIDAFSVGSAVSSMVVLADGNTLATGHFNGDLRLWNPVDKLCRALGAVVGAHVGPVTALAAMRDGSVASGGADQAVKTWSVSDFKKIITTF